MSSAAHGRRDGPPELSIALGPSVMAVTVNAANLLVAGGEAVDLADDDVLRHVDQTAGQVTRVGGPQGGIGQSLAAAVREEELKNGQALAEVRLDGQLERGPDGDAIRPRMPAS